jgi:hypothetical protein
VLLDAEQEVELAKRIELACSPTRRGPGTLRPDARI